MASGAAALKAAAAVAVFAMLVMSSQGHPKTGPLCSDCASQCSTNCSAITAANCSSACSGNYPPECYSCLDRVYNAYENCCSNDTINSGLSCCDNGCFGDCITCGPCDVNGLLTVRCMGVCQLDNSACQACKDAATKQCNTDCNSACSKICVKKDKGY
ncbi:hypothetical protein BAE44_0019076 [Dichanthelium oligosanthes]|uniref:Uncharacterized protein n=1 Tax=Dichanthelium oligosanthes TaxID=888268 RepID=A0A1E5V415_9POAL|nr:hypothetical protein BAE44_0019076 [Dichanthelium oligosanthes]